MSSSREYLEYVLGQLSELDSITYRPMMGGFIIYYHGKIAGGIYSDRFLIKPVDAAISFMKEPVFDLPYPGAKEMLVPEDLDDRDYMRRLFEAIEPELPLPKKRKPKTKTDRKPAHTD